MILYHCSWITGSEVGSTVATGVALGVIVTTGAASVGVSEVIA
jgi:hypothetical protein